MNQKERLDAFYAHKEVDRLPNLTIVGSVVTQYTGIDMETYCKDGIKMADSAILAAHDLALDYVQIAADLLRVAEGYGTEITYSKTALPSVKKPAITDINEVQKIKVKKVREIPRLYQMVEATQYVLAKEKDIYPMACEVGPLTIASNICGLSEFMINMIDEPEQIKTLLEIVTETLLDYVKELAAIGTKYMYLADPVASLLSPDAYQEFALPYQKMVYAEMKKFGINSRLHMCGNTIALLPFSCHSGAYILDVDHLTDFNKALDIVGDTCVLNGNIDPVTDVFQCSAAHTKQAILQCAKVAGDRRAMFMPGCELPTATPIVNVKAIHEALCEIKPR